MDKTKTLAAVIGIMGAAVLGVTLMQGGDAEAAQPKTKAVSKIKAETKNALHAGLTVDLAGLEATARAAHDALQAVLQQIKDAETAMAAAAPGSVEADTASEAWVKAQGAAIGAQEIFNVAMRELETARASKATAAVAYVEERCTNDDGKDADIAKLCATATAAKAEATAKAVAAPAVGP